MRKFVGALSAALFAATIISHAQQSQSVPASDNESSGAWFVELASPPASDGTAVASLEREEAAFHSAASGAGVRYAEKRHFRTLWNGLTVSASERDVSKLRSLPGVKSVFPVVKVYLRQLEQQPGNLPELATALKMTGADIAQDELGLTGRHVRVAVIDTGIDYDHPDLGGCFGPGCRVAKGYDLVGDDFNVDDASPLYNPVRVPDALPDDCNGHGTHVSGIVGANGAIKGVAPGVTFYAYRVFGCEGPTTSDVMLEAMERALDDGADVVNMSIGAAFQWPQYPTAEAANRLVRHGVVVVSSAGNDGASGLYASSAPGIGKDVIGVASYDNIAAVLPAFTISPDNKKIGYNQATGAPAAPLSGSAPMARTGTPTSLDDACVPLAAGSLAGKIALIRRGTCSFYVKALNAQQAGAAGVVLYNNAVGFITPTVAGVPAITIPVVAVTASNGVLIDGRIATAPPVTLTWTNTDTSEPQVTGGLISSFSSYGLAPDLSFKPDLGAPGGSIRSTLPLEQGGYGSLSGTSMASPHVAGAVALMLEARPHTRPDEVQARLQNTARPANWFGNPALGFLDVVHRQGAGMLEIDDAILADAVVSPGSLALGEIQSGSVARLLRIVPAQDRPERKNGRHGHDDHHGRAVTYTVTHVPALATGANTFVPSFFGSFATVEFNTTTVRVGGSRGNDGASLFVKITPPADPSARLFGGYIVLTPDDGGVVLRVPYAGYNGDYQLIQALTPTANGFPWLAKVEGPNLVNQPAGAIFSLQGDDVPFILLHLDHQVRELKMEVIDVATGRSFNFAEDDDYLPRNSTATTFFAFTWDGTTTKRQGGKARAVPDGTYRVELSALKALGNPLNPAHTELWTSPNITIKRPVTTTPTP